MNYYLAIDIGASSGRCILGNIESNQLVLNIIHRFENGIIEQNGHLCWDYNYLFSEIIKGLKKCNELNKVPISIGIDTWGVDFVLLDNDEKVCGETFAYRDARTKGIDKFLYQFISEETLYQKTGIQKQLFNSIYQLCALKSEHPEFIDKAKYFLMVPDYLNFLLTGKKINEYTNATTTQLVNINTYNWDEELIELFNNKQMFHPIKEPGYSLGNLRNELVDEVGFDVEVNLVASHDTASAVLAIPCTDDNSLFISSGTWSLMGTINKVAIVNEQSRTLNFTNSGGTDKEFLFLKNIMGLWLIQEVNRELKGEFTYAQYCEMAEESNITSIIDCQNNRFISPKSMIAEIQNFCKETNQVIPIEVKDIAAVIYNSLAESYHRTLKEFENLSHKKIKSIQIVGGGAQAEYLNKITSRITNCNVSAGPVEGTAIGNLICQMLAKNEIKSIKQSKEIIRNSFEIIQYIGGQKL